MKRIYNNINLKNRNSFGVDQCARVLVEFETADDLRAYLLTKLRKKCQFYDIY